MNIEEALDFYRSLEVFGVQPGLERITSLLSVLGDPQRSLRCIHVAGTNGKGSVCTELSAVLTEAGYNTGLYTSPYVIDFRERIQRNGEMIPPEELSRITVRVKSACEALGREGIHPTAFEAVTAAAFLWFKECRCDVVVLETGLGGRYDATNVIASPLVSVITSISLDHMQVLGSTIAKIAKEKSGIIKPSRPVITTSAQPEDAMAVLKQDAISLGAPLYPVSAEEEFVLLSSSIHGEDVLYKEKILHIPFAGAHQLQNAALVLKTVELLREQGISISDQALRDGLRKAFIPARAEVLSDTPLILIDGAHNIGGAGALDRLLSEHLGQKKLLGITGMMRDKDISGVLSVLLPHFSHIVTVTPSNPRAISADELAAIISRSGIEAEASVSAEAGTAKALSLLRDYDGLIVFGSLYLASDVRKILINNPEFIF